MYEGPGSRLIAVIARLVPWPRREDWLSEWCAELAHMQERRAMRKASPSLLAFSLRLRCLAALSDALWLRQRHGRGSFLVADLQSAFRAIRRQPAFAASIVLTLSLGIGGTTAIFSVIDPLLFRPLPYPEVERLAEVHTIYDSGPHPGVYPDVFRTMNQALVPGVFDRFEAGAPRFGVVTGIAEPIDMRAHSFTPGALELLGARPILGRLFTESDAESGAPAVALISEDFWNRAFARERDVLGRVIALEDVQFNVIGVLPASFKYPLGTVGMWFPLRVNDPIWPLRGVEPLGRLRPGMTREAAQQHIDALATRHVNEVPEAWFWKLAVRPIVNSVSPSVANALRLLAGAVACVLLIACVNAANLLMVRSTARQTELAVRRSLGATSGRLFRQLVTETMVLAVCGGAVGAALAYWGVRAMMGMVPGLFVRDTQATVGLDERALVFSLAVSLVTGFVFGAIPALRGAGNSRLIGTSSRTMTASARVRRMGRVLVVAELALSMMLLVGAGLLSKSFMKLLAVDPGYDPRGVAVLEISLARHRYPDDARTEAFYTTLKERLQAIPGVQSVSVSDGVPPEAGNLHDNPTLETESGQVRKFTNMDLPYSVVDHDYFDALRIRITQGRGFNATDTRTSPGSAVIDTDLAGLLWPNQSPVGQRFRVDSGDWITVVGVTGDVKLMGPDERTEPYTLFYSSAQQTPWRYRSVAVRTRGDIAILGNDIANAVRAIDPLQPILKIASAESVFGESLVRQRFLLTLMAVFTAIAIVLAAIGVYGVMAYAVAQRNREIGLRIALGAAPLSMSRIVLSGGIGLAALGASIGLAAALGLSRFLRGLLYGVTPTDVSTLAAVVVVLGVVAALAALVPAVRAARISPMESLRGQ
jgi:putative ABC transport system permease protein